MNAKQKAEQMYTECSPITQLRGSIPSSVVSTSDRVYCVRGGTLLSSASSPLSFSKAESFYQDFNAFKVANNETGEKKKLSLEEELLAERFRASTDVDIAGVRAVGISSSKTEQQNKNKKDFWLIVKRPGQTLLWKEKVAANESDNKYQLFDLFGQVLKSEMEKYKISAPMDLQVVESSSSKSDENDDETTTTNNFWKFSFVASGNLYVCSFQTSSSSSFSNAKITAVTTTGVSGKLEFGTPDFIMQEEFSRYSGVWWSPNKKFVAFSGCDIADTPQAKLLRPDGSVEEMPFPRVGQDNATGSIFVRTASSCFNELEEELGAAAAGSLKSIPLVSILAAYPWVEYIVRLYWLSNTEIGLGVLSRDQERYVLLRVSVDSLFPVDTDNDNLSKPDMTFTPKANLMMEHYDEKQKEETTSHTKRWFQESDIKSRLQLLLSEMNVQTSSSSLSEKIEQLSSSFSILRELSIPEAWVDINDETHFFSTTTTSATTGEEIKKSMIACVSQEINPATNDGFFHVFVHESNSFWKQVSSSSSLPRGILGAGTRITKDKNGNHWLIGKSFLFNTYLNTIVAIPLFESEEVNEKIHVLSTPTEDAVSFVIATNDSTKETSLIYHSLALDSNERKIETYYVGNLETLLASSPQQKESQEQQQRRAAVEFITPPPTASETAPEQQQPVRTPADLPRPKMNFFEVPIRGGPTTTSEEKLQAMIMYPDEQQGQGTEQSNSSIPLFVYTYGGPHVSYCTLTILSASSLLESMRRLGFAVLVVDSRMATRHSLKVNSDGKRKMGSFEINDVLSAVDYILENQNNGEHPIFSSTKFKVDGARVGIHGFSYGGYVSLLALGQAGDRFKVSVAGAPVTSWFLYDGGYTERYMGILPRDSRAYEESSVCRLAKNFPDEWNRCFILHGFLDENVHITHTQRLIEEFVKEGKPYNLLAYPGERHGIRKTKESAKHCSMMTMRAFIEFL